MAQRQSEYRDKPATLDRLCIEACRGLISRLQPIAHIGKANAISADMCGVNSLSIINDTQHESSTAGLYSLMDEIGAALVRVGLAGVRAHLVPAVAQQPGRLPGPSGVDEERVLQGAERVGERLRVSLAARGEP